MICPTCNTQDSADQFSEQRNPCSFNLTQQESYSISLISFIVLFPPPFLCPVTAWPAAWHTWVFIHWCIHFCSILFPKRIAAEGDRYFICMNSNPFSRQKSTGILCLGNKCKYFSVSVQPEWARDLPNLRSLHLTKMPRLRSLDSNFFKSLPGLRELHCQDSHSLGFVQTEMFDSAPHLSHLSFEKWDVFFFVLPHIMLPLPHSAVGCGAWELTWTVCYQI